MCLRLVEIPMHQNITNIRLYIRANVLMLCYLLTALANRFTIPYTRVIIGLSIYNYTYYHLFDIDPHKIVP